MMRKTDTAEIADTTNTATIYPFIGTQIS